MPAPLPKPRSLTERFTSLVLALGRVVGATNRRAELGVPLLMLIGRRLVAIKDRFNDLARRINEGKFRPRGSPATPRKTSEQPTKPKPPPALGLPKLPHRFGWLPPLAPADATHSAAATYTRHLQNLLADPEMVALIQQAPQAMSRVLRPLCWMLGVKPDPALLPPRQRTKRAKPPKPPRAKPPPEPEPKPRPRGLCEPPGRYAPGAWIDRVPPHWRDVLEGTVAPRRRHKRKTT